MVFAKINFIFKTLQFLFRNPFFEKFDGVVFAIRITGSEHPPITAGANLINKSIIVKSGMNDRTFSEMNLRHNFCFTFHYKVC